MITLNSIGQNYLTSIVTQMKELKLWMEGDNELILNDTAIQYQLYHYELELSIDEPTTLHHMRMSRHLKIVQDNLKQLGLTPLGRHKLKAAPEKQTDDTIFDTVAEFLKED